MHSAGNENALTKAQRELEEAQTAVEKAQAVLKKAQKENEESPEYYLDYRDRNQKSAVQIAEEELQAKLKMLKAKKENLKAEEAKEGSVNPVPLLSLVALEPGNNSLEENDDSVQMSSSRSSQSPSSVEPPPHSTEQGFFTQYAQLLTNQKPLASIAKPFVLRQLNAVKKPLRRLAERGMEKAVQKAAKLAEKKLNVQISDKQKASLISKGKKALDKFEEKFSKAVENNFDTLAKTIDRVASGDFKGAKSELKGLYDKLDKEKLKEDLKRFKSKTKEAGKAKSLELFETGKKEAISRITQTIENHAPKLVSQCLIAVDKVENSDLMRELTTLKELAEGTSLKVLSIGEGDPKAGLKYYIMANMLGLETKINAKLEEKIKQEFGAIFQEAQTFVQEKNEQMQSSLGDLIDRLEQPAQRLKI